MPKKKCLVIVESPAKSKTINKILGSDFKVFASMGHIIDLPHDKMGIDFENNFKPEYVVIKGRKKYLDELKKEAKSASAIYLATDPDREGEAICWHIKNELEKKCDAEIFRVGFDEITEKAVKEAFKSPTSIDINKVNAQQARRILDRIVGYSISPLLWRKVTRGLSAGRVQSVAVRLIVEREEEIKKFKSEEYWSIDAVLKKMPSTGIQDTFQAKLAKYKDKKISISNKDAADKIILELKGKDFVVTDISRKEKKSYPRSPYTTSALQQDAFNKLNFSASKTMRVAQTLYEGVELGEEGSVGLITYMRTDSVRISSDAQSRAREYILEKYGEKYLPKKSPFYKSKKGAQEAHEAIRPALPLRSPESISAYLKGDEYRLYELVWKRFISSQMENALYSVLAIHIAASSYIFHAGGGVLIFDGFLRILKFDTSSSEDVAKIPSLEKGEKLELVKMIPEQHFTKPLPRYTDASLVKELEEKGIGRPSTYAPIIRTVIDRNYVERMEKSLKPTELGVLVNKLLVDNFSAIINDKFTAKMENELDEIEEGRSEWVKVLQLFYNSFTETLEEAKKKMATIKKHQTPTSEVCEKCGRPMVIKWGRRGRFMSCSGFPACRNAKSITTGVKCPNEGCGGELVERKSKRGVFYGCTNYPRCLFTAKTLKKVESGIEEEQTSSDTADAE